MWRGITYWVTETTGGRGEGRRGGLEVKGQRKENKQTDSVSLNMINAA